MLRWKVARSISRWAPESTGLTRPGLGYRLISARSARQAASSTITATSNIGRIPQGQYPGGAWYQRYIGQGLDQQGGRSGSGFPPRHRPPVGQDDFTIEARTGSIHGSKDPQGQAQLIIRRRRQE